MTERQTCIDQLNRWADALHHRSRNAGRDRYARVMQHKAESIRQAANLLAEPPGIRCSPYPGPTCTGSTPGDCRFCHRPAPQYGPTE